jgi:hypothetical protein
MIGTAISVHQPKCEQWHDYTILNEQFKITTSTKLFQTIMALDNTALEQQLWQHQWPSSI